MCSKSKKIIGSLLVLGLIRGIGIGAVKNNEVAPDFVLFDTHGKQHILSSYKGNYVVLEWTNPGCPFVKKHYDSGNMQALQKEFASKKVVWLSVCSSAKGKEGSMSAADWNKFIAEKKIGAAAVLLDSDGTVGKQYGAKATPHMFVINPEGVLIYQGAIDDRPTTDIADVKEAKNYVRQGLNESMSGKKVSVPTTSAYGCSIKY